MLNTHTHEKLVELAVKSFLKMVESSNAPGLTSISADVDAATSKVASTTSIALSSEQRRAAARHQRDERQRRRETLKAQNNDQRLGHSFQAQDHCLSSVHLPDGASNIKSPAQCAQYRSSLLCEDKVSGSGMSSEASLAPREDTKSGNLWESFETVPFLAKHGVLVMIVLTLVTLLFITAFLE